MLVKGRAEFGPTFVIVVTCGGRERSIVRYRNRVFRGGALSCLAALRFLVSAENGAFGMNS